MENCDAGAARDRRRQWYAPLVQPAEAYFGRFRLVSAHNATKSAKEAGTSVSFIAFCEGL